MMGCLAALSLAGCGDSGGGSSTVPSESLISEGYHLVLFSDDPSKVSYICTLKSDGKCLFYPHGTEDMGIIFTGRWSEESLGGEKFRITFSGFSKTDDPFNLNCEITFTQEITLTIKDMSAYRAAQAPVEGYFDQAPFTHEAGTECPDPVTSAGTELMLQMLPVGSSDL